MMEIQGKYNRAKVFAKTIDAATKEQILGMCNQAFVEGKQIRVMPDTHAGAGCTIGATMEVKDHIVPNWVGVDIACGMTFVQIPQNAAASIEPAVLDQVIRERIPAGMQVHERERNDPELEEILGSLYCKEAVDLSRARKSIGTLGGGNHFIELAKSEETGDAYLVIHCGSRRLGLEVAKYYQKKAAQMHGDSKEAIAQIIQRCKTEGRESDIHSEIEQLKKHGKGRYPKGSEPLTGKAAQDYLHDMLLMVRYAHLNRKVIATEILQGLGVYEACAAALKGGAFGETIHNYIEVWREETGELSGMLRKGAVSAKAGEEVLIPMNMRDGSLLCVGKGNADWNYSAPHGAGRLLSRTQARGTLSMEAFRESMSGVYTTTLSRATLDEAPMAYKDAREIEEQIGDTVEVREHLRPLYNFKAAE